MGKGRELLGARSRINERLPSWIAIGYLTVHLKTQYGIDFIEYVGQKFSVLFRKWNNWAAILLVAIMAVTLLGLGMSYHTGNEADLTPESDNLSNMKNVLIIPGVSDLIPLSSTPYLLFALFFAVILHELGHAFAAAAEGIDIEEIGFIFLFGLIPVAGYMKPDEEQLENARPLSRIRVGASGIVMNVLLLVVTVGAALAFDKSSLILMVSVMMDMTRMPVLLEVAPAITEITFWFIFLNFNLALFNSIPIRFLDGGVVAHGMVDGVARKAGYESEYGIEVLFAAISVVLLMLIALLSM